MKRASTLVTVCLIVFGLAATARAQDEESDESDDSRAALLHQGEFEIGADIALLWSVDSSKPKGDGGEAVSFNSYYGDLGAHVGYMVQDLLEARLHLGWLRIVVSNQDDTPQRSNAFVLTPQLLFHAPVTRGLALYGGLGAGGYVGQTNRDVNVGGQSLDAENATNGLIGQLLGGVLIQTGPSFALRTGLRLDGLVGREIPSEGTDLPKRNTQNVKLIGVIEGSGTF